MRIPTKQPATTGDIFSSMTPMIDVVFQLLIFFLCTASLAVSEQILPTALPRTGNVTTIPSRELQELELIRIGIRQESAELKLELNGTAVSDIADLRIRLRQLVTIAQLPVVLDITHEVEIAHVVAVYDSCLIAGIHEIHFGAPEQ